MMRKDLIALLLLVSALVFWLDRQTQAPEPGQTDPLSLDQMLGEGEGEFPRVVGPRQLEFPADHASHDEFRNEWWYFTGNLADGDGRRYGFQFTLFRFNLGDIPTLNSAWFSRQLWMAHFALSDLDRQQHISHERFARGALGLAGASADRWWLNDWTVTGSENGWTLVLEADDLALELKLTATRPSVLQGDRGYSRKGPEPGQASHYYSYTRLAAEGALVIDGQARPLAGLAWLDREWGSGQLDRQTAGWDWFALQLDDGRDLMVYRLRLVDGQTSPFSAGILVEPSGQSRVLAADDFELEAVDHWRDETGVAWPIGWRLKLPADNLSLRVKAAFEDQLWRDSVRYWEGAVEVLADGQDELLGRGYLELSGYADSPGNAPRR